MTSATVRVWNAPHYFNTENFVRIVFKRPDMSKWTHDGFVNDTAATENDTVVSAKPSKESSEKSRKEPSDDTTQIDSKILRLIAVIGERWLTLNQLLSQMGFASRGTFNRNYVWPATKLGIITLENPDSPNAPNQRYGLTDKGKSLYYIHKPDSTQE